MNISVNEYKIEKIKNILKNKKIMFFCFINDTKKICLSDSFKHFFIKTYFAKNLIKKSVLKQIKLTNLNLWVFLDATEKLHSDYKQHVLNSYYIVLKNNIYYLKQFFSLSELKFAKKLLYLKHFLKIYLNFKVIKKFYIK